MFVPIPYIAGFFDGEGSVGLYPSGTGNFYLRTQLTQNVSRASRRLLEELRDRFGGNLSIQTTTHGEKFNWQLNGAGAARFLCEIEQFLIMKRDQVDVVLLWWSARPAQGKRGPGGQFLSSICELDEPAARLVKALKHADIQAVMDAQADHVEIDHTLRQVLCVKG